MTAGNSPAAPDEKLREALAGREFNTSEDLQAFIEQYAAEQNRRPREEFQGLSPDQMDQVLHYPFKSPELVMLPEVLDIEPEAPMLSLFEMLVDAIGEKGLKATAKGNLPRNFCREADVAYWDEKTGRTRPHHFNVNLERDFPELHTTRIVAELSGLVRKYKGRFILSRDCRRVLANDGMRAVYPRLLKTYVQKFNWAYNDGYPNLPLIQNAWLFVLYLITLFGDSERQHTFYEDAFLCAFPSILDEVPDRPYSDAVTSACRCFTLRALSRFADFLGLARMEQMGVRRGLSIDDDYRISALPLLRASVLFKFPE